jgi:hypothetical protein
MERNAIHSEIEALITRLEDIKDSHGENIAAY